VSEQELNVPLDTLRHFGDGLPGNQLQCTGTDNIK